MFDLQGFEKQLCGSPVYLSNHRPDAEILERKMYLF